MEGPAGGLVTLWTVRSPKPGKSVESLAQTGRPQAAAGEGGGFVQVRRGAFTAVVVAGSLALAGCSGGGEDPPPTTSSTSSSSSTSSTPSATTQSPSGTKTVALPPEATKHTEAGAMAFARYYWAQASQSLVTNDASGIEAMSGDECSECAAVEAISRKQEADGVHSDKASYDIKIVRRVDGSRDRYVVSVAGNEVPVKKLDNTGRVLRTTQAGTFSWATTVEWRGRWQVTNFQKESG